ncbi:MAG: glycosyltransferase family 2 protein [Oceanicaulis sp.]
MPVGDDFRSARGDPLISIVTVVFNDVRRLQRTADSVLSQTGRQAEWLIVDGRSTDGGAEFAKSLEAERVRVWSEPDAGLYDAMNKGAERARGLYLNFLNAGDVYRDRDTIDSVAPFLNRRNSTTIFFGGQILDFGNGICVRQGPHKDPHRIRHSLPASHQAFFIPASLQRSTPFDLSYRVCADYESIARMLASGAEMQHMQRTIVISEKAPEGVTYRRPIMHLLEAARVQKKVLSAGLGHRAVSALRRLAPLLFWRLCAYAPGIARPISTWRSGGIANYLRKQE